MKLVHAQGEQKCWTRISLITANLLLFVWLSALLSGCRDGSGPPIHFIIPNGFKGKIDIIYDASNGADLTNRGETLVCAIPSAGQLRVKSLRPFQSWHSETASYEDGSSLLPASSNVTVSFFALGSYATSNPQGSSTQGVTYFVGTKAEAEALKY